MALSLALSKEFVVFVLSMLAKLIGWLPVLFLGCKSVNFIYIEKKKTGKEMESYGRVTAQADIFQPCVLTSTTFFFITYILLSLLSNFLFIPSLSYFQFWTNGNFFFEILASVF
jgi:hypothetical protein